jgi:uncharacterized delta-60 repeat protein
LLAVPSAVGAAPILDTAFGGGAITPKLFEHGKRTQVARSAVLQADGKVVVPMALSRSYGHLQRRAVIRYNADGTRDLTYGVSGAAWVSVPGKGYVTFGTAVRAPDGGVYVTGGYAAKPRVWSVDGQFVAHIDANGLVDQSFGNEGAVRIRDASLDVTPLAVAAVPGGGVVIAQEVYKSRGTRYQITRVTSSGQLDSGFGRNGQTYLKGGEGLALAGDQVVVLKSGCAVTRYLLTANAQRDFSFGVAGTAGARPPAAKKGVDGACTGVTRALDGTILVSGWAETGDGFEPMGFVTKLSSSGAPDQGFGVGGSATGILSGEFEFSPVVPLPGGGVLLTTTEDDPDSRFDEEAGFKAVAIALDASGKPDASFGTAGVLELMQNGYPVRADQAPNGILLHVEREYYKDNGRSSIFKFIP